MKKTKRKTISRQFIEAVCARLAENKRVRRALPQWGRVHIDRQLPFLCVYRRPHQDSLPSERLVVGEAAYLTASGNRRLRPPLALLIEGIARTMKEVFGSFLIVEVWIEPPSGDRNGNGRSSDAAAFKIVRPKKTSLTATIDTLQKALGEIKIRRRPAGVEVVNARRIAPPGLTPLFSAAEIRKLGCHLLGIGVSPVFQDIKTGQDYPLLRRELQRGFARAIRNGFFRFTHDHTTHRPLNYQSLGRWSMVKAIWEVDRQLAEICHGFDFLFQVSPANIDAAWAAFQRSRFERAPEFIYRPLPMDPVLAKRRLFKVPIERLEDPTLAELFREQQLELDRKFTMLIDRGTERFMYGSLQLYGPVDDSLLKLARALLRQLSPRSRDESSGKIIDARAFAARAVEELNLFRKAIPGSNCKVLVRDDITGLMVSQGNLLVGKRLKISENRMEALIQHEVGTHILTYLNGKAQPFRQLYVGLAGYEELQEGLAVLSEYLVGGLTRPRLRLLAARVVAAHRMVQGASFVEVFRELNKTHSFAQRTAYTITMRTFRCGGLTKDAVYLRGLVQLLDYLKKGGALEPLFVGKIAAAHVPIVQELQWRKVLRPAPLRPRYLQDQQTVKKLNGLRNGQNLMNLITRRKR